MNLKVLMVNFNNGINPSYLEFLFDDDFSFSNNQENYKNIQHTIEYSKPSYLYQYDNSEEIMTADLKRLMKMIYTYTHYQQLVIL